MNDDEYPSDGELEALKHWPQGSYTGLVQYICNLWHYPEFATITKKPDGTLVLTLITGGWSGNESIILALGKNMFSVNFWELSQRGGLHVYEIPKYLQGYIGTVDGCLELSTDWTK